MKKSFVATLVCAASAFMLLTAGMSYAAEDAPKVSTTFCNMLATDHPQSVAAANVLAKEIAEKTSAEEVIIIVSTLLKDLNSDNELFRANSLRVLSRILDVLP